MSTITLLLVLGWTTGVAFASYRLGYSEGHNDATIHAVGEKIGAFDDGPVSEKADQEDA